METGGWAQAGRGLSLLNVLCSGRQFTVMQIRTIDKLKLTFELHTVIQIKTKYKQDAEPPMLAQCRLDIVDGGPTSNQHRFNDLVK